MPLGKRVAAEFLGTFWLVFGGCGSAVLAAGFPTLGIGFVGVSLAFGLTVLTMAYAVGHISGAHFNPAVSIGLYFGKRFPGQGSAAVHYRASHRRRDRGARPLRDRIGKGGLQYGRWLRIERLRAITRPIITRCLRHSSRKSC